MKEKGFDEASRKLLDGENIQTSEFVKRKMVTIRSVLPSKTGKSKALGIWSPAVVIAACLLCVLVLVMANFSAVYAQGSRCTPADGDLIRVFTVRNYSYSDPNHEMDIDVPNISDPRYSEAADQINKDVDEFTAELAEQFYKELEAVGDKGHGAIFVDYEVLMNRENWFTLKLTVNSVTGSSNSYYKIYNIDRNTGKIVTFSDLFCTSDFDKVIKQDIMKQMKERTEENNTLVYFTDKEDMWEISDKQNFYFSENGELVIPFDKYEVAPGSMGNPEFTINKGTLNCILKPEYQSITS